ncbi:LCP family protein [Isoptericola sp. NPDC060257]|uniref:LCP family protein n=1 Tax=Isoptericola sp. NPDC060257 TaxID=3347087 RepID=UPI0036655BB7
MTRTTPRHVASRPGTSTGPSHARALRRHTVARTLGMGLTAVLAFVAVGGATAAVKLTGNITAVDSDKLLGADRPEKVMPEDPNADMPLNIVLMGSDSRGGDNADIVGDGTQGARSDTTMIMHISSDRSRVEMLSIPRDTTIDIPSCPTSSGGQTSPVSRSKFNGAFAQGVLTGGDVESGALCAQKTIETITDVQMDGFVVVDFAGFEKMVDALGGVELCIPNDIDAPKADHLVLSAGVQELDGDTALKYARARTGKGLGDGSDLGRIGRQQELLAAVARQVMSAGTLADPTKSLKFLGAVTGSMTMSSNFASIQGLAGLAYSARNVRPDTIAFMTAPYMYDPNNAANVLLTDEADEVWDNLKHDRPLSDAIETESDDAKGGKDGATKDGANDDAGTGTQAAEGTDDVDATPVADDEPGTQDDEAADDGSGDGEKDPEPKRTRDAGEEAFTGADVTSVCG